MAKTIYLANPYGFSAQQRTRLLPEFIRILEALGVEVWEPFTRNNQVDSTMPDWAYRIGQRDVQDVRDCDAIFAIVNGTPPDEGVMVELGIAVALSKTIFLFRDDFRRCADCESYPLNLMVFAGLPAKGWEDYYYTSLDDIAAPTKALVKWLNGAVRE
jgi:nucleoside 2-deoxyribosyltransferase